jgi:hypothetical protein
LIELALVRNAEAIGCKSKRELTPFLIDFTCGYDTFTPSLGIYLIIEEIEMMTTLTIELPVAGLPSAAELPANFSDEARFLLAVKLFEQGRISSGKAGRLCDMGRVEFLLAVSRSGVPVVDLRGDELEEEFS